MSGKYYPYLFEVKSVQSYLFSSGKLKDMVAASDELDGMTSGLLDSVLSQLEMTDVFKHSEREPETDSSVYFSRRAGGAVYAVFTCAKSRQRFQALWSFRVRSLFPAVECLQVVTESGSADPYTALQSALDSLNEKRNLQVPQLPSASPISMRAQRTGRAAVAVKDKEAVDEVTYLQRRSAEKRKADEKASTLTTKFLKDTDLQWPVNFEQNGDLQFPFDNPEDKDIALIHADGNGIGQVLMSLRAAAEKIAEKDPVKPLELFRSFSTMMEKITSSAAETASEKVLRPAIKTKDGNDIVPARPLVLGGDDITLLCRPGLALPFLKIFCEEFRKQSGEHLDELKVLLSDDFDLPKRLTASGGIALIKANQPFMQCHDLVESLCKTAKGKGKANLEEGEIPPAMVSFHRVAATMINTVDDIREHEWKVSENRHLSLEAYCLEESEQLPKLSDLSAMYQLFTGNSEQKTLTMNRLREVATLVKESRPQAIKTYQRWQEMAEKNPERLPRLKQFFTCLEKLTHGEAEQSLPFAKISESGEVDCWGSPLSDLLIFKYLCHSDNGLNKEVING